MKVHPFLKINTHSSRDVTRLLAKLKLLCGTYIPQTNRQRFNKNQIDPTCLLCNRGDETISHFLLECSSLDNVRLPILQSIDSAFYDLTKDSFSRKDLKEKISIILDCSILLDSVNNSKKRKHIKVQDLANLEYHLRRLTYILHITRYEKLFGANQGYKGRRKHKVKG